MAKLSETLGKRNQSNSTEQAYKTPMITIMGRRIMVGKLYGHHTRRILKAEKGVEARHGKKLVRSPDWDLPRWLINDLVREVDADGSLRKIRYDSLSVGEETDLLLLIRLASLGRPLSMRSKCRRCNEVTVAHLDCGRFQRFLMQPREDAPDDVQLGLLLSKYDPFQDVSDDQLTVDWSELPTDYLDLINQHHRDWLITLPESNTRVEFHQPLAIDKPKLGAWVQSEDPDILVASLAQMVQAVDGEAYKDEDHRFLSTTHEKKLIASMFEWTLLDLLTLRDFAYDEQIGVDTAMSVRCVGETNEDGSTTGCGHVAEMEVPFSGPFFLPERVRSRNSTNRLSRYQREKTDSE